MAAAAAKIFGIGLSKTGTSSLAQALQMLGFRTLDNMGANGYVAGDLSSIDLDKIEAHDALTDTPIPSFYRELDRRYPGSKFILTVRDREGWLKSCMKQFSPRFAESQSEPNKRLFLDLYGTNAFDAEKFASGYDRFVAGVLAYFDDRPQDLLVLDVAGGEGWERLCPFVGRPVPDLPFPKANVTQIRWTKMEDLVAVAEEAGRALMLHYRGEVAPAASHIRGGASAPGRRLLDRAMKIALRRGSVEAAEKSAHKTLSAGLNRLNLGIPILSRADGHAALAERSRLNHAWLVDPLDGRDAFVRGGEDFSVDIALIEDGRPIYGVVHAPAKGVTYYGRTGKGALRQSAGTSPVRLMCPADVSARPPDGDGGDVIGDGGSAALRACALLESWPGGSPVIGSASESGLASAHAVLSAAGLRVYEPQSGAELAYNRPPPALALVTVRR